jgi:NADP-dependent 3-hydroxy acid dehydrogenase YdfG
MSMSQLQGKTALVTGGGSGIGQAVAKMFLQAGARVAIAGRNLDKLQRVAAELNGGKNLTCHALDVADKERVKQVVQEVTVQHGPIDILVNNAGTNLTDREARQLSLEAWDQLIRTNLDGAFYCIHAVLPAMLQRQDGMIVNVSSIAGKRASPLGGIAYTASKFGMTAMGLCLGVEEKDSGIRVSNIYPGEVDTPILEVRPNPVTEEHRQRILQPEDVAAAVVFVCTLPPRVSVPELIIKPTSQAYC